MAWSFNSDDLSSLFSSSIGWLPTEGQFGPFYSINSVEVCMIAAIESYVGNKLMFPPTNEKPSKFGSICGKTIVYWTELDKASPSIFSSWFIYLGQPCLRPLFYLSHFCPFIHSVVIQRQNPGQEGPFIDETSGNIDNYKYILTEVNINIAHLLPAHGDFLEAMSL